MRNITQIIKDIENNTCLLVIKPGFLNYQQSIVSEIKTRGLFIKEFNKKQLTLEEAKKLYKVHKEEDFYDDLCRYMSSGISVGLKVYGENVVSVLNVIKDNFRDKYSKSDMRNVIHSSDSIKNTKKELKVYFG